MNNILVTGADGFIGHALLVDLKKKGYNVIGWSHHTNDIENSIYAIDMRDEIEVRCRLLSDIPMIIFHCAGCADVANSVKMPDWDLEGNVRTLHNLMFGLHSNNMHNTRVIVLSSAAVYGNPQKLPITEDTPIHPMSPYALHKVMSEDICDYCSNVYNMDIRIARVFSAYGRGLKKQIFWDMYRKYVQNSELKMFGTGSESRDYIHIADLVNALELIGLCDDVKYKIYNVANGEEITILKAAEQFAICAGMSFDKISFLGEGREGDPQNWCADISRLISLGYSKKVDFCDGLEDYFKWCNGEN